MRSLKYYENLWSTMEILPSKLPVVRGVARMIHNHAPAYQEVEEATGVPWQVVGCIHYRESGFRWDTVLHNGEAIIGTGKKTRLVPRGKGPFGTWQAAAIDALSGIARRDDWPIEIVLRTLEGYNGWGYQKHDKASPYIWSYTNHGVGTGYYTSDGHYDATAVNQQSGCAPLLSLLDYDARQPRRKHSSVPLETASHVSAYQQFLVNQGIDPGPIDGIVGPRTRTADRRFRSLAGL